LSAGVSAGEKVIVDAPADLKDGGREGEKTMSETNSQQRRPGAGRGRGKVFHRGSEDIHVLADLNLQVRPANFWR
jgi:hypothetical protein